MTRQRNRNKEFKKTNRLLEVTRFSIPYIKELKHLPLVKSTNACILMQQIEYWMERSPKRTFYKFAAPPSTEQYRYKVGQSWVEELGISQNEFTSAFDQIGVRYRSKREYNAAKLAGDEFQGKYYCSYFDKISRLTHYFRNDGKVEEAINIVRELANESAENGKDEFSKSINSDSREIESTSLEVHEDASESSYTPSDTYIENNEEREEEGEALSQSSFSKRGGEEEIVVVDTNVINAEDGFAKRIAIPKDFSPTLDEEYRAMLDFPEISPSQVTAKFIEYYRGCATKLTLRAWHQRWWDWVSSERSKANSDLLEEEHSEIINKMYWHTVTAVKELPERVFTVDDVSDFFDGEYSERTVYDTLDTLFEKGCLGRVGENHYFNYVKCKNVGGWEAEVLQRIRELELEDEIVDVRSLPYEWKTVREYDLHHLANRTIDEDEIPF